MKILSIKQPWASLIVHGLKDIENRTWRTNYRGPLLVHASLRSDDITAADLVRYYGAFPPSDQPRGGIVGIVDIVDCVRPYSSRWYAPGCWGFVLANARPLPFVRWKGALSLRDAPRELLMMLKESDEKEAAAEAAAQLLG
jgi:ASCH domain